MYPMGGLLLVVFYLLVSMMGPVVVLPVVVAVACIGLSVGWLSLVSRLVSL